MDQRGVGLGVLMEPRWNNRVELRVGQREGVAGLKGGKDAHEMDEDEDEDG